MSSAEASKLENNEMWRLAMSVAKAVYARLDDYPEDEKWGMQSRSRGLAFNLTSDIAEAVGSTDPRTWHYKLAVARGTLFGIRNVYKTAHDTKVLALDPEAMVQLDDLTRMIDQRLAEFPEALNVWEKMVDPPKEVSHEG